MKALIVGYGSIGKRHARLLSMLVDEVRLVTSQKIEEYRAYPWLADALKDYEPDYVVISNVTSAHATSLNALKTMRFTGKVLVEKPLFNRASELNAPYPFEAYVAYHLRFHKVIEALAHAVKDRRALSAHIYVGQHLSHWRLGRDHRQTYSAHKAQGGGVLRDLSHELDLINRLFGPIEDFQAMAARVSGVTVDSEDVAAFVLRCRNCPIVSLQMNCIDFMPRREWQVNTADASLHADIVKGTFAVDQESGIIPGETDDAYRAMHEAMLAGEYDKLCTLEEGMEIMKIIDAVPMFDVA